MKIIYSLLLLFCSVSTIAQNAPLQIKVTDFENNPLQGEQVLFVEQTTKKSVKGVSDANGDIKIEIPAGVYDIKLKSVGDAEDFSTFEVPKLQEGQSYNTATMQIQISEAKSFTLDNLHFDTGKWSIKKTSFAELNELVEYLKLKKNINIEIAGHTDSDGDDDSNLSLSQKRADEVKKYLISKGISSDRVKAVGYGETKPVASNDSPQGKALNRRTEVTVL